VAPGPSDAEGGLETEDPDTWPRRPAIGRSTVKGTPADCADPAGGGPGRPHTRARASRLASGRTPLLNENVNAASAMGPFRDVSEGGACGSRDACGSGGYKSPPTGCPTARYGAGVWVYMPVCRRRGGPWSNRRWPQLPRPAFIDGRPLEMPGTPTRARDFVGVVQRTEGAANSAGVAHSAGRGDSSGHARIFADRQTQRQRLLESGFIELNRPIVLLKNPSVCRANPRGIVPQLEVPKRGSPRRAVSDMKGCEPWTVRRDAAAFGAIHRLRSFWRGISHSLTCSCNRLVPPGREMDGTFGMGADGIRIGDGI